MEHGYMATTTCIDGVITAHNPGQVDSCDCGRRHHYVIPGAPEAGAMFGGNEVAHGRDEREGWVETIYSHDGARDLLTGTFHPAGECAFGQSGSCDLHGRPESRGLAASLFVELR